MPSGNGKCFSLNLAKRVLLHMLSHADVSGVVHTDLNYDNIFFRWMSTEKNEIWIKSDLPRLYSPEQSQDGIVQADVSQPLPLLHGMRL
jgi:hypothetical protein